MISNYAVVGSSFINQDLPSIKFTFIYIVLCKKVWWIFCLKSQATISDVRQKQKKFPYTRLENVKSLTSSSFNPLNFILHILCRAWNLALQTKITPEYKTRDSFKLYWQKASHFMHVNAGLHNSRIVDDKDVARPYQGYWRKNLIFHVMFLNSVIF